MKIYALLCLTVVALLVSPTFLSACSCAKSLSPQITEQWLAQPDHVVFEGEVLRVDRVKEEGETVQRIVFKVTKGWKKADSSEITVWINGVGACCDCSFRPQKGEKWLMEAYPWKGRLYTSICSFSDLLARDRSQQRIRELEQITRRSRD
jgi:hypothetical protein